ALCRARVPRRPPRGGMAGGRPRLPGRAGGVCLRRRARRCLACIGVGSLRPGGGDRDVEGLAVVRPALRVADLPPYLFAELDRRVAAKRAEGVDVISLGVGDPDLPTPR